MLRGYSHLTANTKKCVNVRRASDNATTDIGLINGVFDRASAIAFAGVDATGTGSISGTTLTFTGGAIGDAVTGAGVRLGTTITAGSSPTWTVSCPGNFSQTVPSTTITLYQGLYVVTLYDQSGNGNDATQATAAQQPQLFLNGGAGGTSAYFSGNIAASQTGSQGGHYGTQYWVIGNTVNLGSNYSFSIYFQPIPIGASTILVGNISSMALYQHSNAGQTTNLIESSVTSILGGGSTSWFTAQIVFDATNGVQYLNGSVTASGAGTVNASNDTIGIMGKNFVGSNPSNSQPCVTNATEFVLYPSLSFTPTQYAALQVNQAAAWP